MRENISGNQIVINGKNQKCPLTRERVNAENLSTCLNCEYKINVLVLNGNSYKINVYCSHKEVRK